MAYDAFTQGADPLDFRNAANVDPHAKAILRAHRKAWINDTAQRLLKEIPGYDVYSDGFIPELKEFATMGDTPVAMSVAMVDEDGDTIVTVIIGHNELNAPGSPFRGDATGVEKIIQKASVAPTAPAPAPAPRTEAPPPKPREPTVWEKAAAVSPRHQTPQVPILPSVVKKAAVKKPQRHAPQNERDMYSRIMQADAALAGLFKSFGNSIQIVGGSAADLALENPKLLIGGTGLAAMTAAASLAITAPMMNSGMGDALSGSPISLPASAEYVLPERSTTIDFSRAAPPEVVVAAPAPSIKPVSAEALSTVNSIQNDGLRAVAFEYTQGDFYQRHNRRDNSHDQYISNWQLDAAAAVDDLWQDRRMRTRLRDIGFEDPTQVFQAALAFAAIESRSGQSPRNNVNDRVLGLYHFEETTFMNVTRRFMGIEATLADRMDTRIATQAFIYLLEDNIKVAGRLSRRWNASDFSATTGRMYSLHVLGADLAAHLSNRRDNDRPADFDRHDAAKEDNGSLYYNLLGVARTRNGMYEEFQHRMDRGDRISRDQGFEFDLAQAPETILAMIPTAGDQRRPATGTRGLG